MTGTQTATVPVVAEDVADSNPFQEQIQKTRFCRFYTSGTCTRGSTCHFAHSSRELRRAPDLTKTSLCKLYKKGACTKSKADCPFAHGVRELRMTPMFQAQRAEGKSDKPESKVEKKTQDISSDGWGSGACTPTTESTFTQRLEEKKKIRNRPITRQEISNDSDSHTGDGDKLCSVADGPNKSGPSWYEQSCEEESRGSGSTMSPPTSPSFSFVAVPMFFVPYPNSLADAERRLYNPVAEVYPYPSSCESSSPYSSMRSPADVERLLYNAAPEIYED